MLCGRRDNRSFTVECPNQRQHTTGRPGDGSTVLWVADESGRPFSEGVINCLHAHCHGLRLADWRALLELGAPTRRTARVTRVFEDVTRRGGIRLALELDPTDGGERLPYLRVSAPARVDATGAIAARWGTLWEGAGIKPPLDLEPDGDLGGAIDELPGRMLQLEIDPAPGRVNAVRRILPAVKGEAA